MSALSNQKKLRERIKELECLYEISTLVSKSSELKPILPKICNILSQAFQFPEITSVTISLFSETYSSTIQHDGAWFLKQDILFQGEWIGNIRVSYKSNSDSQPTFLKEEKKLLKKVSEEISFLYEREHRVKNEEALNAIVRRQEKLALLGEMTAGVAHELNTPLGNVIGFAEFILESSRENNSIEDAKKIKQSALHAREIVKKLMLFSCNVPQRLENECIDSMIGEALDLISPLLKQSNIEVEFFNHCPLAKASIDKVQFIQVLFNLLNNAIQASQTGNKIHVSLSEVREYINISIQDFGSGIPVEIQDKIFDPFFTYNKEGRGNGLGLSVVHGIIKQHKGRIQFSSEVDQGSTFVISIPKTQ